MAKSKKRAYKGTVLGVNTKQLPYLRFDGSTDIDYEDRLNEEELEWMRKFNNEWSGRGLKADRSKNLNQGESVHKELQKSYDARKRDLMNTAVRVGDSDEEILAKLAANCPCGKKMTENAKTGLVHMRKKNKSKENYWAYDYTQLCDRSEVEDALIEAIDKEK